MRAIDTIYSMYFLRRLESLAYSLTGQLLATTFYANCKSLGMRNASAEVKSGQDSTSGAAAWKKGFFYVASLMLVVTIVPLF